MIWFELIKCDKALAKRPLPTHSHTNSLPPFSVSIRVSNKRTLHGHFVQSFESFVCCCELRKRMLKTTFTSRVERFPRKFILNEFFFRLPNLSTPFKRLSSFPRLWASFSSSPRASYSSSHSLVYFHKQYCNNCVKTDNFKLLMPKHVLREKQQRQNSLFPGRRGELFTS